LIRGIYTSAAGMMTEIVRQETITNNLANSETAGFKKDLALQRSRTDAPLVRVSAGRPQPDKRVIGSLDMAALINSIHTRHSQGALLKTDSPLDFALVGSGYFTVETEEGVRYTRNGAFTLDAERCLVTENGNRVLGINGYIILPEGDISVDGGGEIYVNGIMVEQLRLADFADPQLLIKEQNNLFAAGNAEVEAFTGRVMQGWLEGSNVDVQEEIVDMMTALRSYQASQRVLQAQDELLQKAANEVGALR
jgi:flagellar basal-body rod protein FlgF